MNFSLTAHAQKGVSCAECHVKHAENLDKTAHTVPDHSFKASLDSCNTCHAQQMHSPTEAKTAEGITLPATIAPTEEAKLAAATPEPDPVSPIGFSAMAGFIGLAGGMVLAPWLERWYHRVAKHNREEDHE